MHLQASAKLFGLEFCPTMISCCGTTFTRQHLFLLSRTTLHLHLAWIDDQSNGLVWSPSPAFDQAERYQNHQASSNPSKTNHWIRTILSCQPPISIKKTYGAPPGRVSHHGDAPGALPGDGGTRHACAAPCSQRRRRRFYTFGAPWVASVPWRRLYGGASVFGLGGSLRIGEDQDRNEEGNSDISDHHSIDPSWKQIFLFLFLGDGGGAESVNVFCALFILYFHSSRCVWLLGGQIMSCLYWLEDPQLRSQFDPVSDSNHTPSRFTITCLGVAKSRVKIRWMFSCYLVA